MECEFEVPTFPWKVENEENPRILIYEVSISKVMAKVKVGWQQADRQTIWPSSFNLGT